MDHRIPFEVFDGPLLGLCLGLPGPVPVQVEVVVVRPATGPIRSMLPTVRVVAVGHSSPLVEALHDPLPTIRVRCRVDDHNGLIEDVLCYGVRSGGELIHRENGRLGPCRLTSVHAVREPGNSRAFLDDPRPESA